MIKKSVLIGLCCLLMVALPSTALAQEPNCTQLSAEDCELLSATLDNMHSIGLFHNTVNLVVGGSGGTSEGNSLALSGSGPFAFAEDGSISQFHLFLDDEGFNNTGLREIIMLEDMLYTSEDSEAWNGIDISAGIQSGALQLLSSRGLLGSELATITRLEDAEIDGQPLAVFQLEITFVNLLSSPEVISLLAQGLSMLPEDGEMGAMAAMTEEDLAAAMPFLGLLIQPGHDAIRVTLAIEPETQLVYHFEAVIDFLLDATMIAPEAGQIGFNLDLVADLSDFGIDETIEAPAEFTPTELDLDLGALMSQAISEGGAAAEATPIPDAEQIIAYNEVVAGSLSGANQADIYGFEGESGDVVTIIMRAVEPEKGFDSLVSLVDSAGNVLISNDDHDGSLDDLGPFDSLISEFTLPEDGLYRLVATWPYQTRNGDYELVIEN